MSFAWLYSGKSVVLDTMWVARLLTKNSRDAPPCLRSCLTWNKKINQYSYGVQCYLEQYTNPYLILHRLDTKYFVLKSGNVL